ncbi:MAG: MMPL family transporter [Thermoguttaceae bacterium]|nr:MMPL family transporter [Thermoguttaceae bacterium]MDW8036689.1 MMPL family transporter [Thermoguttaceae bacterium]
MMNWLAAIIVRRWIWVLAVWIAVVVLVHQLAPPWDSITRDGDFAYLPAQMSSVRGEQLLEAAFPEGLSRSQVAIVVARPEGPLNAFDFAVADRLERLLSLPLDQPSPITHLWSYQSEVVGRRLMRESSQGGQAVLLVAHLKTEFMAIENMRLLRTLHRATEAVQLEQMVVSTLQQQQESRRQLRDWHRKWLQKQPPALIPEQQWNDWLQAQRQLQETLAAYAQWFWSRPSQEAPELETALAEFAQAAYGLAQNDLAELIQSAQRWRSQSPAQQAANWNWLLAKQEHLIAQLDNLQKAGSRLLELMLQAAISAPYLLDAVPVSILSELASVSQRLQQIAEGLPAEKRLPVQKGSDFSTEVSPGGLRVGLSGSAAVGADMLFASWESIRNTEWVTVLLVVVVLVVVYRAPGLVLIPLGAIVISVVLATDLVALAWWVCQKLGWEFMVFKTTRIFIVVLVFGSGTDFCLFLISRYKEELQRGREVARAITHALASVADALAASALTTVIGLATMIFADFGKFRNGGPVIAFCLLVMLAAAMTLAPAMLRMVGRGVFWPLRISQKPMPGTGRKTIDSIELSAEQRGLWFTVAKAVLARPGWILLGTLLVLAPLAVRGTQVPITYDLLSELPPDRPSVRGTRLLEEFFLPGETGPITVLAEAPASGDGAEPGRFATPEGRRQIAELTAQLFQFRYIDSTGQQVQPIVSVRSLVEPLGGPPGSLGLGEGLGKLLASRHPKAKARFLAQAAGYEGRVTRFDLVCQYDPFSRESMRLLEHVEEYLHRLAEDPQSAWYGIQFHFAGTTAAVRDLALVTASDQQRIQRLVVVAVLAVLILILRRIAISMVMILSVVFGYFVTMGLTDWVFRWWYGPGFEGLDWKVPIFLFVILIAVGQDYNIYLATRAFEEERRRGWREGLRVALVRTGGIITSCGVIMAGTFASMLAGSLRAMQELGFALSMGVLLDTLIIRTVFMPAFLSFWAWWQSEPVGLHDRLSDPQQKTTFPQKEPMAAGPHLPSTRLISNLPDSKTPSV